MSSLSTMPPEIPSSMKCLINMNISVSEARVQDASVSFNLSTPSQNASTTSSTDPIGGICDRPAQLEAPANGTNDTVVSSGHFVRRKRPRLSSPELGSNDEIGPQWYEHIYDLITLLDLITPDSEKHDVIFNAFLEVISKVGIADIKCIKSFILEDCEWYRPGTWICLKGTFLRYSRACLLDNEECDCISALIYKRPCLYLKKVDGGLAVIRVGPQK
ncbi:uncharacterized protein F4817DRAFT_351393 [Daldinia loculata]|uniref:uncharacterized protein n=1 Tax=Daldinia loculata TaxID=103429 RepID=UPI0020C2A76D|nr:uncharacterized protein F4817DRAFT_351393 [Daldinia loculata]KAI1642992.1 hypothetical protein F4817DRAFT_351393 [Daldinia loculata]